MPESRLHPRSQVHHPVAFQREGQPPRVEATCRDLSLGGMFIETPSPPPYGAAVVLFFSLPGLPQEASIPATVRWTQPAGMGVQFSSMGARETHALTELLRGTGG